LISIFLDTAEAGPATALIRPESCACRGRPCTVPPRSARAARPATYH